MFLRGPEWDQARSSGIGGSEAAAAIGVSPWKTRLALYKEKRGEIQAEEISSLDHVHFGTILEPIVRNEYANRTGLKVRARTRLARCRRYPFMIANIDFDVFGTTEKTIGEAKTVGMFAFIAKEWGEPGSPVVPIEYYAQAQHNMIVAAAKHCEMPCLIGGQQFRIHKIPLDIEFAEILIKGERDFWECVAMGKEPPAVNVDDLLLKFPKSIPGRTVVANIKTVQAYRRWLRYDGLVSKYDVKCKGEIEKMKAFMGDAEELTFNGARLATWRRTEKDGKISQRFLATRLEPEDEDEMIEKPKGRKIRPAAAAELGLATEVASASASPEPMTP